MSTKILLFVLLAFSFHSTLFSQVYLNLTDLKCPGGIPTSLYMDKRTDTFYAGCWGGIWKYNSTQNNWTEVDADPDSNILANAKITAMYIDSKGVFYAGTDGNTQSYISFDGGKKWSQIQNVNFTLQNVRCIMEHPNESVLIGTDFGILKTPDNGKTWEKLKHAPSNVSCLFVNSKVSIYAGVSSGMYSSTGNDTTWVRVSLPGLFRTIYSIDIDSKHKIYCAANGDFYKSDDDGISWYSAKDSFANTIYPNPVVTWLTIANNDFVYIIIGFGGGFWRSKDEVKTWEYLGYKPDNLNNPNWSQIVCDSKGILYGLSPRYGALKIVDPVVNVEKENQLPISFSLSQNYPNPFNPSTTIRFSIPTSPVPSPYQGEGLRERLVTLKVYDLLGREVTTLINEEKTPGNYEVKFDGTNFPSGVYFYTLSANSPSSNSGHDFIQSKKMLLMK